MRIDAAADSVRNRPASIAFQKFTNEDGLTQNTIFCLLQDSKGFLWIGTWHGLSRFDGYQFVNYTRDFQTPASISDNRINSLYETKNGEIWVGTRDGLNRYNYATDDFDIYKFDPENPEAVGDSWTDPIFEDSDGTLWIGTKKFGLAKFDRSAGKFTFFKKDTKNPENPDNNIAGIGEDKNGRFWVATWAGLYEFDRESGRFTPHLSEQEIRPKSPAGSLRNYAMLIDSAGLIWLGADDGLTKFDPNTDQFERYAPDQNDPRSLSGGAVRSIYETKSGALWIGTQNGLNSYVKETDDFAVYRHDPADQRSLGEGVTLSIMEDNRDQLWVGTSIGGLSKYNQKTAAFQIFRHDPGDPASLSNDYIFSIVEDKRDNLWFSHADSGLIRYDSAARRFEDFKIVSANISGLYADMDGRLWIGSESGLVYLDPKTNQLTKFETGGDINLQSVSAVMEDRGKNLWFGTRNGELARLDRVSGALTAVKYQSVSPKLSNHRILAIFEDSLGCVWIGTGNMLSKIDPATGDFTEYRHEPENQNSLSDSNVSAIYEDTNDMLWFGTESGGLNRFDRAAGTFTRFTERDGLPNNRVYEILDDGQGHLWLSTDLGLARFNTFTLKFRNFDVNDGLPNNEFNDRAALKSRDGAMYFGTMDGVVHFYPQDITDSDFTPPIYLTDVRVLERPLKTGQNITQLKELHLSRHDYVVSFDFAALDSAGPKKLLYQWKLEGFDEDWIHGATRRTATYSNLPGGEYILKVKATNVEGIWTESDLNLKIVVTPPFYKTFWFLALAAVLFAALLWLGYRIRTGQMRAVSKAQTRFTQKLINSQEAERKRIAAELHDGLGQNLVIIKNRAMLGLSKGDEKERVIKELNTISESAAEALEEVREITNNLRPHLLDRLGLTRVLASMCRKVSDVVEVETEIDSIDKLFDETEEINIYRIVQESLNNIIKHSNAAKAIVRVKRLEDSIIIHIKDNGRGFDVSGARASAGGLGLTGLKERAELINGEFSIVSDARDGTRITVKLPIQRARRI